MIRCKSKIRNSQYFMLVSTPLCNLRVGDWGSSHPLSAYTRHRTSRRFHLCLYNILVLLNVYKILKPTITLSNLQEQHTHKIMRTTPIYYAGASRIVLTVLIICGHNVMVAYMLSCCKAAVVNWNKFDVVMIGGRYRVKWTSTKRHLQLNKVELEPHTWMLYGMTHKEALYLFKF